MIAAAEHISEAGNQLLPPDQLLYLEGEKVQEILDKLDPVTLAREVFRLHGSGQTLLPDEAYLGWKTGRNESVRSLNMPSFVGGRWQAAGTKIINSNPANVGRGIPRASGLTLLFHPETARVCCVMEASRISALRTASVSILCIKELANAPLKNLAVIGTGVIGRTHINLAQKSLDSLERIVLYDLDSRSAAKIASEIRSCAGARVEVSVAASAREAVATAEAVITATTVTQAYVPYEWIKPGAVLVNVSLDDLASDVMMRADLLFVDDWNLVRSDTKRLLGRMYREGLVAGPKDHDASLGKQCRKIDGEIADIVLGVHPGRTSREQKIVVNPFGLGIEDVAFAACVFKEARQRGVGLVLSV